MALTPEDVVNKRFQPTKFREGYDQDEVDDFLDEVVVELRRLNQENEELRQRVIASDQRISQLQAAGPVAPAPAAAPAMAMPAPVAAPIAPPPTAPEFVPQSVDQANIDQGSTNNLLQLARTLHEQHVREGIEKRDALIAEGQATATRVMQEAEEKQRAAIGDLDQQRTQLESRIEELRNFERDYRAKLKGYIEGQLRELDSDPLESAPRPPAAAAAPPQQEEPHPPQQAQPQQQPEPGQPIAAPAYGGLPGPQVPQGYPGFAGN